MLLIIVPGLSFEVAARGTVGYRQRMAAATAKNLEDVRAEILRACRDASRNPADVMLIAVSKTFSADAIEPAIVASQRVFGENRVQEAKANGPRCFQNTRAPSCISSVHCSRTRRKKRSRCSTRFIPSTGQVSAKRSRKRLANSNGDRHCSPRSIPARSRKRPVSCRRMRTHS